MHKWGTHLNAGSWGLGEMRALNRVMCRTHAILWRKKLDHVIKPIDLKCNWCTAVEINTGSNTVVVISVYLPYQSPDNEVEYLEKLGYINAVTNDLDTTCFVIVGDWN